MKTLDRILTYIRTPNPLQWKDNDALAVYSRKTGFVHVPDRFGYLNKFSNWNYINHHEKFPDTSYTGSFSDIMFLQAEEIIQETLRHNKELCVLWSGGVDSTSIVLAFLEVLDKKDLLTIIYTESSLVEYPLFFKFLTTLSDIKLKKISINDIGLFCSENGHKYNIVNGFPADQLFYSTISKQENIQFGSDWRDFIKEDVAIQQFEEAFTYYNIPIKTIDEFTWYMNFSCKWLLVKRAIPLWWGQTDNGVIPFFDRKEFQDWSISNFDTFQKYDQNNPKYYKLEIKQFINKLFPDEDYLNNKTKTSSIVKGRIVENLYNKVQPNVSILDGNGNLIIETYPMVISKERQHIIRGNMLNKLLPEYRKN